jgi:hypothetical protein
MVGLFLAQILMSFNVAALPVSLGGMVEDFGMPPTSVSTAIVTYGLVVAAAVAVNTAASALRAEARTADRGGDERSRDLPGQPVTALPAARGPRSGTGIGVGLGVEVGVEVEVGIVTAEGARASEHPEHRSGCGGADSGCTSGCGG